MKELKPCPFCGSKVDICDIGEDKNDHYFMIQCKTPTCNASTCFGERESEEDFIRAWNRRAGEQE